MNKKGKERKGGEVYGEVRLERVSRGCDHFMHSSGYSQVPGTSVILLAISKEGKTD